jgi:hypothetical protein
MKPSEAMPETVDKPSRDQFVSIGTKVMTVPKAEIERREKAWKAKRRKKR